MDQVRNLDSRLRGNDDLIIIQITRGLAAGRFISKSTVFSAIYFSDTMTETIEIKEAKVVGQDLVLKGFRPKIARFGKRVPFLRESVALFEMLSDPAVSKAKKAAAVGALLYFINPLDAIPDFSPFVGFVDDAAVIAAAVTYLRKELENYLI
jgi:uncharacterized membrane protein YkvA (DUF1232 family)